MSDKLYYANCVMIDKGPERSIMTEIPGVIQDIPEECVTTLNSAGEKLVSTLPIIKSRMFSDFIPVIIEEESREDNHEEENENGACDQVIKVSSFHPVEAIHFESVNDTHPMGVRTGPSRLSIFWINRLRPASELLNSIYKETSNDNNIVAKINCSYADGPADIDEIRMYSADLFKSNGPKWQIMMTTLSSRRPFFAMMEGVELCPYIQSLIYKTFAPNSNIANPVKIEITNTDIGIGKINLIILPDTNNPGYENLKYYIDNDFETNSKSYGAIRNFIRIFCEIEERVSFMTPSEDLKDTLENWDNLMINNRSLNHILMNSAYGMVANDEPIFINNDQNMRAEVVNKILSKKMEDAERAVTPKIEDPTPMTIPDDDISKILSSLNNTRKKEDT